MEKTGWIVYESQDVVVIATLKSKNAKTGNMIQTWILARDINPSEAIVTGEDSIVCGSCPHRPVSYRAAGAARCYVDVARAPLSVWRAYHRGRYAREMPERVRGRSLRIGSYGDPAAVPFEVWQGLVSDMAPNIVTGYTHQWRTCDKRLRGLVMASCDSWRDWFDAKASGWRTFRILASLDQARTATEIACPASTEAGNRMQCASCGICDGLRRRPSSAADVAIVQH